MDEREIRRALRRGVLTIDIPRELCLSDTRGRGTGKVPDKVKLIRLRILNKLMYNIKCDTLKEYRARYIELLYNDNYSIEDVATILELSIKFITAEFYKLGYRIEKKSKKESRAVSELIKLGYSNIDIYRLRVNHNASFKIEVNISRHIMSNNSKSDRCYSDMSEDILYYGIRGKALNKLYNSGLDEDGICNVYKLKSNYRRTLFKTNLLKYKEEIIGGY